MCEGLKRRSELESCANAAFQSGSLAQTHDRSLATVTPMRQPHPCTNRSHAGADVFREDDEGADPLDLAEQSGRASTAEALRKLQLKVRWSAGLYVQQLLAQ